MDQMADRLHTAWNRKLYVWWDHYNDLYLSGALRRPVIEVAPRKDPLGRWASDLRTISLARSHIEQDPWLEVMDTLRHEMAHQFVDEVLRPGEEPPHGPAFHQACTRLRCEPRRLGSSGRDTGEGSEDERILRVLGKVLSLASSPNCHEAEAAMQKARELLLKHNLDLLELDRERGFSSRRLGQVKGRRSSSELWVAGILGRFFFVEVLWNRTYDAARDREATILEIYGTPGNLDMAEYVYAYLHQVIESLWTQYRSGAGVTNRERQRFLVGVLEGFYRRLETQERSLKEAKALVWKGDPGLKAHVANLHPRLRSIRGGGVRLTAAYRAGLEQGARLTLRKPVEHHGQAVSGSLPAAT